MRPKLAAVTLVSLPAVLVVLAASSRSGLSQVAVKAPQSNLSSYEVVFAPTRAATGTDQQTVSCPRGKKVLSSGIGGNWSTDLALVANYPIQPTSEAVRIVVRNHGTRSVNYNVFVVCAAI